MPATMNFFQHQEKARENTSRLVFLFGLAIAAIILVTYLVVYLAITLFWTWFTNGEARQPMPEYFGFGESYLFAGVVSAVIIVIGFGTIIKIVQLRGGGRAVAESVGGRLIDASAADPQQRKLLDVVEEMAIASGIPVPPVYILNESGINAFAAGYTPKDAVVAVTQGSIERLSRDELQGVIGHEFSHILNGDMRLSIELVGVLNGILAIGIIGWMIFRLALDSGSRKSSDKGGGISIAVAVFGLVLVAIGYIGTFFGNLIKAAVGRQREFLADASSVQFTRNPSGIAGALKKIGGFVIGSRVEHHGASAVSHMFFCEVARSWLGAMQATHPPLPERIRRVEPAWDGKFTGADGLAVAGPGGQAVQRQGLAGALLAELNATTRVPVSASVAERIGKLNKQQLDHAVGLIEQLPESVKAAAREPFEARALVFAMLINQDAEARIRQIAYLRKSPLPGLAAETERLLTAVQEMDDQHRLPVLDLAMPALRQLSGPQYREFRGSVEMLILADGKTEPFEWMLYQLVQRNLGPQFSQTSRLRVQYYGLGQLKQECSLLLSSLAYAGQRDAASAQAAFDAGSKCLMEIGSSLRMLDANDYKYALLETALDRLNQVSPRLKQQIVEACSATVLADGCVTVREMELLRGMLAILGCPVPPPVVAEDKMPVP